MKQHLQAWLDAKIGKNYHYKMEKIRFALDLLGNPERTFSAIHVAGTNGKGSTVAFLRQLFQSHGYQVGTFVSPHLIVLQDRICINGQPISESDFWRLAQEVAQLEERVAERYESFNYFETLTLIMFLYFSQSPIDVAVIEVGIGGLLDTTNVIDPAISLITSIGLDHQDMLGNALTEIAVQKAGIIKPQRPVVVGPLAPEALAVCQQVAQEQQAPFYSAPLDYQLTQGSFTNPTVRVTDLVLGLKGRHQEQNAGLALQAFYLWQQEKKKGIDWEKVREALSQTRWPGRLEQVSTHPAIYLDGAHNLPAIKELVSFIRSQKARTGTILFSALKRKDFHQMLDYLQEQLPESKLVVTSFTYDGVIDEKDLGGLSYEADSRAFVDSWRKTAHPEDLLGITGSLYFISDIRPFFIGSSRESK